MATISHTLEQAIRHHQAGRFQAADSFCQQVLRKSPKHREALWLLGAFHQQRGNLKIALQHFDSALSVDSKDVELHMKRGEVLGGLGRLPQAQKALEQAINLDNLCTDALYLLGNVCFRQGDFTGAVEAYSKVRDLQPKLVKNLGNLGSALSQLGRDQEAINCYEEVVKLQPNNPGALHNLGSLYSLAGQYDLAAKILNKAHQLDGKNAKTLNLLGQAYLQTGKVNAAVEALEKAIQLDPTLVDAYSNLATTYRHLGREHKPIEYYQKALNIQHNHIPTLLKLGAHLSSIHRHEEAASCFHKALKYDGTNGDAISGLASIWVERGDVKRAKQLMEDLLAKQAPTSTIAVRYARLCVQAKEPTKGISTLKQILAKTQSLPEKGLLFHCLADTYDQAGDYKSAFEAYQNANNLRALSFDSQAHSQHIQEIIDYFSQERLQEGPKATNNSQRPIFIVGMPRSGTSLTEQILDCHPSIHGAGELEAIEGISRSLGHLINDPRAYPHYLHKIGQKELDFAAQKYLKHLQSLNNTSLRVSDKLPMNFMHLGLISLLFPQAKIIHIQRDPMDTCLSCYVQNFKPSYAYTTQEQWLVDYYQDYTRLMDHWRRVLPLNIFELAYDELVDSPEQTIRQVLDYCELPWDSVCLNPHQNRRVVKTASNAQVKQPIRRSKISRSERFAAFAHILRAGLEH